MLKAELPLILPKKSDVYMTYLVDIWLKFAPTKEDFIIFLVHDTIKEKFI